MLRWVMSLLVAIFAIETAAAADGPVVLKRPAYRATQQLPPGLPRAHYKYRTTIAPATPPLYVRRGRQLVVVEDDANFIPYVPLISGTPLLPGSSTLPGYYGRAFDYDYQGPYYGGPQVPYWNRLPYACGVYGYC